jgi:chromate transport protein ChrA
MDDLLELLNPQQQQAVAALILAVVWVLGQNGLVDLWTVLLLGLGLFALIKLQWQPFVVVLVGLVIGIARALIVG